MSESPLFPLPLTPFERLMVVDERPGYPMTFHAELLLQGEVDRAAMREAFRVAIESHPLIRARLAKVDGRWQWTRSESFELEYDDFDQEPCYSILGRTFDLTRELGFRGAVSRVDQVVDGEPVDYRLSIVTHHALADGLGIMRLLGDWIGHYHRLKTGESPRGLGDHDETALRNRDGRPKIAIVPSGGGTAASAPAPSQAELSKATRDLAVFFPQSVARDRSAPGDGRPRGARISRAHLGVEAYKAMRAAAVAAGVHVNVWMLAELYRHIWDWNVAQGARRDSQRTRLLVPVSMRATEHKRMPAANCLSFVWVQRRARDCPTVEGLRTGLHQDFETIASHGWARTFVDSIEGIDRWPGALWFTTRLPLVTASAVFSNAGDLPRRMGVRLPWRDGLPQTGNLRLIGATGAPPARPGTRVAIALAGVVDRLFFAARAASPEFDQTSLDRFLSQYVERLERGVR